MSVCSLQALQRLELESDSNFGPRILSASSEVGLSQKINSQPGQHNLVRSAFAENTPSGSNSQERENPPQSLKVKCCAVNY